MAKINRNIFSITASVGPPKTHLAKGPVVTRHYDNRVTEIPYSAENCQAVTKLPSQLIMDVSEGSLRQRKGSSSLSLTLHSIIRGLENVFKEYTVKTGSFWSCFYDVLIPPLITAFAVTTWLIPKHDVVKYPQYWPETIISYPTFVLMQSCSLLFDSVLILNIDHKIKRFGYLYAIIY